jgi:hypothetical protein
MAQKSLSSGCHQGADVAEVRDSRNSVRRNCWLTAGAGLLIGYVTGEAAFMLFFIGFAWFSYGLAGEEDRASATKNRVDELEHDVRVLKQRIHELEGSLKQRISY